MSVCRRERCVYIHIIECKSLHTYEFKVLDVHVRACMRECVSAYISECQNCRCHVNVGMCFLLETIELLVLL